MLLLWGGEEVGMKYGWEASSCLLWCCPNALFGIPATVAVVAVLPTSKVVAKSDSSTGKRNGVKRLIRLNEQEEEDDDVCCFIC